MAKNNLSKHKIIKYSKKKFTLLLDDITDEQKKRLVELCDLRRDEFIDKYSDRLGVKTLRQSTSGTLAYDIFSKTKGVCVACGISAQERELVIDHILPLNVGGKTEYSNLQALCRTCNAQKRDRDDVDFIDWQKRLKHRNSKCSMCNLQPMEEMGTAHAIRSKRPMTNLHSLVLPKRHTATFFDLIPAEKHHCFELIDIMKSTIEKEDKSVVGFNVGFDSSSTTNQSLMHCQIHVIPYKKLE